MQMVENDRELSMMYWGFVPRWADEVEEWKQKSVINARLETIDDNGLFKQAYKQRRVLVPSTGFFEWKGSRGNKTPYYIYAKKAEAMAFAGIYDVFEDEDDEEFTSFAIVTQEPNEFVAEVHDRMPMILRPDDYDAWLRGEPMQDYNPVPSGYLAKHAVTKQVNDLSFDSEKAIEESAGIKRFTS